MISFPTRLPWSWPMECDPSRFNDIVQYIGLHSVTSTRTLTSVHDRQPICEAPMTHFLSQSMHASSAPSSTQFVAISSLHSTCPAKVAAPRPRFCIDQLNNTFPRAPPQTPALQTNRLPFDRIAWPRVGPGAGSFACVHGGCRGNGCQPRPDRGR